MANGCSKGWPLIFKISLLLTLLLDVKGQKKHQSYLQDLSEHLEVGLAVSVRKVPRRQLHQRDPQAPDIGANVVVRLRRVRRVDPLGGHVGSASGGPSLGLEQECKFEFPALQQSGKK